MNANKPLQNVNPAIQVIRNQRVVISTDLAHLHEVLSKVIIQVENVILFGFQMNLCFNKA